MKKAFYEARHTYLPVYAFAGEEIWPLRYPNSEYDILRVHTWIFLRIDGGQGIYRFNDFIHWLFGF